MSDEQFVPCVLGPNLAYLHTIVTVAMDKVVNRMSYTAPDYAANLNGQVQAYRNVLAQIERLGEAAAAKGEKA